MKSHHPKKTSDAVRPTHAEPMNAARTVDAAIAELSKALISPASLEEVSNLVLEQAEALTRSRYGFVGYIDPETGHLVSATLTRDIWKVCRVADKSPVFETFTGLWGEVLHEQQALMTNQPSQHPASVGVPEGHVPIRRFLSVPAVHRGETVGQIALANADCDYAEDDLRAVERLAELYALAVIRRRADRQLEQLNACLEERVAQRTLELEETNRRLMAEVEERERNYLTQAVLASVLHLALERQPLEQVLQSALDSILEIPWLGLAPKGAIWLATDDPSKLVMQVQRSMPPTVVRDCTDMPFGHCLCGQAALTRQLVFDSGQDSTHAGASEVGDHGHYCVPITASDRTLGVICLYFEAGRQSRRYEETFLVAIASALAGIIVRTRAQDRLRSLASELSLAEERVRRGIAGGLHDRIGQCLAQCKYELAALRAASENDDETAATFDSIAQRLDQTIRETRSLTFELSPPILYDLGLEAALEWLLEDLSERCHIAGRFTDDGAPKPLGEDKRVLLFRSVRELLVNVERHAQADNVEITVSRVGDSIRIDVADDGVGIELTRLNGSTSRPQGFGLFSVRERMGRLDGRLELRGDPGQGTVATLLAPLDSSDTPG